VGLQFFGYFQDGDVADNVKRARKESTQRVRHIDDVFVAPDGCESLVELPLFHRETDVQALRCRKEYAASVVDDAKMLFQRAETDQPEPDFLAAFPRHDDTPRPHDSAIPRLSVKDFRTRANP